MVAPREPDRFDIDSLMRRGLSKDAAISLSRDVAAALRAAESSALERAAQIAGYWTQAGRAIRTLIPPAAAPAAEGPLRRTVHGEEDAVPGECYEPDVCVGSEYIGGYLVPKYAPAAKTGKARGAEALNLQDYDFALGQLRHLYRQMVGGNVPHTAAAARGLLGPSIERFEGYRLILAARAAPPEREGTT